jgi:hypothetical protein
MKRSASIAVVVALAVSVMGVALGCRSSSSSAPEAASETHRSLFSWFGGPRVPAGTTFKVRLLRTLSSESAGPGDRWDGEVTSNIVVGDRVVIPAGSRVEGKVDEALPARRGSRAMLHLRVTSISANGKTTPLDADATPVVARSPRTRNLGAIAGGAAAGALLGKMIGGDGGDAAKGAVVGGGVATGIVAASKGYQVVLGKGAVLNFRTEESVAMR